MPKKQGKKGGTMRVTPITTDSETGETRESGPTETVTTTPISRREFDGGGNAKAIRRRTNP